MPRAKGDASGAKSALPVTGPPEDDLPFLVALANVAGIGAVSIVRLVAVFGSARAAWSAPPAAVRGVLGSACALALAQGRTTVDPDLAWAAVGHAGAHVLVLGSAPYPVALASTDQPPAVLFVRGDHTVLYGPVIAIVGTRQMTRNGSRVTRMLAGDLARAGVTVVSGMARGVDTVAHEATLEVGGATAAVLGCGVDIAFPSANRALLERIAAHGVVVSEYPPGFRALRHNFPMRNRIIAGLARAVVVVEAGERSGALITAKIAAHEGRTVCAVPGPAGVAVSAGTHKLLRDGAPPVASAAEILEDTGLVMVVSNPGVGGAGASSSGPDDSAAGAVLEQLRLGPASVDDLSTALHSAAAQVNRCLTVLEIQGLVRSSGGGEWEAA